MHISIIVAAAENNAIGKNNQLLWHLPNDLKFFKNTTWGMPVIMGRKTFESVNKPLPGRMNIVITRQANWQAEGVTSATSLKDALHKAEAANFKQVFVIGGGEIYKEAFHQAQYIYLTRVHTTINGDTFFPSIHETEWELISNDDFEADDKHQYAYSFQKWKHK
jgi:dihydrofolate reductase